MRTTEGLYMLGLFLLLLVIIYEWCIPSAVKEGFLASASTISILTFPPRGDIGTYAEEGGFVRDDHYFHGYADVSRLGVKHDYCRLIAPKSDPENPFFACALAGTENLSSTSFRSRSVKDGLRLSRDDYVLSASKVTGGRASYCRILRATDGTYQPLCIRANTTDFDTRDVLDQNPPEEIKTLLKMYSGCVSWLRFFDDRIDMVGAVTVLQSGVPEQEENPALTVTKGVHFNGIDTFLRLTDSNDISLGTVVPLRSLRAFQCWVFFDSFTNNAPIFDFGNGAGVDNVRLTIVGKGDGSIASSSVVRSSKCDEDESKKTLPSGPSGQQPVSETTPQHLMETTDANVNAFQCTGFAESPRALEHPFPLAQDPVPSGPPTSATLLYEVWDGKQRKMRIKIPGVIPLRQWTHIVVTAASQDSYRPDISVYVNGEQVSRKPSGFLPTASSMTSCYIGKSNWSNSTSQYENKDGLFHGSLFDFRLYRIPLSDATIQLSYAWGREKLGLAATEGSSTK